MKVKERIEELRPFCTENTDYDWCKSNLFIGKAMNRLWDKLNLYNGSRSMPSTQHNDKQMKKYKYAEQKLYDYIADNVGTILELTIEEKDKVYSEILNKAVEDYEKEQ